MHEVELVGGPKDGDKWNLVHDLLLLKFVTRMDSDAVYQAPVLPGTVITGTMIYRRTDKFIGERRVYEFDSVSDEPYIY